LEQECVLSVGVNLVLLGQSSLFHAEVVTLLLGQQQRGEAILTARVELVTSSEPCAQCLGAICWSGIKGLVCGAPVAAAEAIGFDEGPVHPDWPQQLVSRGIEVTRGVLSARATRVLEGYRQRGGAIYSPSS
jgi:tRNA(Arg) A34 adenosine deaminase TadA